MNLIKPVAETPDTVTLHRADFEALLDAAEDAADRDAIERHRAYEAQIGWETAKASYLTGDEMRRLLNGAAPVRVWREKRGLTQRALGQAASVSVSYLAEIEAGRKPGSAAALARLAQALGTTVEALILQPHP